MQRPLNLKIIDRNEIRRNRKVGREIYPSSSRDRVRVSLNLKGINPICIDERRGEERKKEASNSETGNVVFRPRNTEIGWYLCLKLPWKTGSQFSNWNPSPSANYSTSTCIPSTSLSFPVATNRNLFKQAVRLTGSLLRRRFAGKLQFPAWNLPEIIS